jgi:hypothetical protein
MDNECGENGIAKEDNMPSSVMRGTFQGENPSPNRRDTNWLYHEQKIIFTGKFRSMRGELCKENRERMIAKHKRDE